MYSRGLYIRHLAFLSGHNLLFDMDTPHFSQPPHPACLTRRDALKTIGASAAFLGLGLFTSKLAAADRPAATGPQVSPDAASTYPFALPPLGYDYDALEPHIDARTMEIHYTKHHQAYVTNANNALASQPKLQKLAPYEILALINGDTIDEPLRATLRNNVGGHANHSFFWQILTPNASSTPADKLAEDIDATFGSFDAFKAQFTDAAMKRFGSGWAWLVVSPATGKLAIVTSANQDSPLLTGDIPVLGIDVWEHAYYLKYQNRRADYITAFWDVVNWPRAEEFYAVANT